MRRGHPGIGGWRGDNPRHFRPRSGGAPHYRPPRSYGLLDQPRYPLSGPRMNRGPHPHPFNTHDGRGLQEHHDRNYRGRLNNNQRLYDRGHDQDQHDTRHIFPLLQRMRHNDVPEHPGSYKDSPHYYEDTKQPDRCHINSLGDVDHRQSVPLRDFDQRKISPWANPPPLGENKRHYYDNRNHPADPYRHNSGEVNTIPIVDTGHRPPSSDHYGSTSRPAVDNNNTSFSRSIDDTVDIVRKRLMNRNDSRRLSIDQTIDPNYSQEEVRESMSTSYLNVNQEQPTKKKIQRQRQFVKSNCDKIKTKIVHQLFKMDKDRIHKLMDNPSSSTKFEYAISSLITESQNSLNRHMRSVAEKSLCNSSEDFIHDDNNTIYEDTFMKQMQCILEPQDTVLLEDIKPLVMAELSKVLQLDDFEHRFDTNIDQGMYPHPGDEHPNYDHYANEFNFDEFTTDTFIDNSKTVLTGDEVDTNYNLNQETNYDQSIPLYERRPTRHSNEYSERIDRRMSSENQHKARRSLDNKPAKIEEPLPLFNAHEQFSDDDDPFAELDKQYHVAVDHNFIETDDPTNQQSIPSSCSSSPNIKSNLYTNVETPYNDTYEIKEEIENEIQNIARSPIKIFSAVNNNIEMEQKPLVNLQLKQEFTPADLAKENEIRATNIASHIVHNVLESSIKQENITKAQEQVKESENSEISVNNSKSSAVSTPRKRSIDQKPSHRKEKRKKSESSQSDASFEISNKTTITDSSKPLDKSHESSNSVFNLFFSSDVKDHKKEESSEKSYSDKYVKRKDPNKKEKEKEKESKHKKIESKEKHNQCSSGHSILSPKDNNQSSNSSQTPTKIDKDTKKKLKPIDMFNDQPKKPNSIHHARRNTATITATKNAEENKPKKPSQVPNKTTKISVTPQVLKKLQSKETQTCLSKSSSSRFCQTDKKKFSVKGVQTDPVTFAKPKFNSKDAFERMKEIDLEIQVLLQEKFKLYSSLESKDSNKSSMETLGMAVLNVETTKEDEDNEPEHALSEDTIVDDFTNIPVEELEQIAFESVQDESNEDLIVDRRSRRTKVLEQERKSSASPNTKKLNKKSNAPNISLIEQIIIDDRPLEDIISLDALENVGKQSPKNRKRPSKSKSRKNKLNNLKKKKITKKNETNPYDLKECVVLLIRKDMSRYIRQDSECGVKSEVECIPNLEPPSCIPHSPKVELEIEEPVKEEEIFEHEEIVEETVENDLQFDMLDVSEDIVIGDNCEVKSIADKVNERVDVPISEEIILDNSQSSIEDMVPSESVQVGNECRMFDYSTDENLRRDSVTVVGNADAVLAIECIENDFIAACLDGNVYHFGSDGQLLNTLRGSNLAVTCLTIVKEKYGTTVYTGSLDSRIRYYDLETGLEKGPECNVLSPIQTMDRAWDTVFVGTRTGFVLQFECKNNMLIPVSTVKFSEQSILALRAMKEGPRKVLLVAARSENVTIKDAQTGLLLRTLCGPKMTVYTLLFEDGKVYCGTSSHHIHVFDYSSGGHVGSHSGGKGAVCLRALGGLVFAGCYDGCVYVYREGEARPIAQLRGPSLMLLSLAVVGTKIIAGYKDRSLYIWKIPLSILQEMIL